MIAVRCLIIYEEVYFPFNDVISHINILIQRRNIFTHSLIIYKLLNLSEYEHIKHNIFVKLLRKMVFSWGREDKVKVESEAEYETLVSFATTGYN